MDESKKTPNYLLKGDLSGIQEFVFNVQSKGAAKTLKVKSYYVQIITELCEQFCIIYLKKQSLGATSFYNGGGNFFIEIYSDSEIGIQVKKLQEDINRALLNDEMTITLAYVEISNQTFEQAWGQLLENGNKAKLKRNSYNMDLFQPFQYNLTQVNCNLERFTSYFGHMMDHENELYREIHRQLVKENFFTTSLFDEITTKKTFDQLIVNKLPLWKHYDEKQEYEIYRKSVDDEFIFSGENLIDFDGFGDFAEHRTGTNMLGVLSMDVDNLGNTFGHNGMKHTGIKALSKKLQDFFDNRLYNIWKAGKFDGIPFQPNIYPIFAGGDDCFIVGGWDAILHFSKAINDAFKDTFTSDNLSLSAGIIIINPRHPVVSFAELVKETQWKAKSNTTFAETQNEESHKKNSICIFDEVFTWDEYSEILKLVTYIVPKIENKLISRSFLDKLRNSAKGFHAIQQQILREQQIELPRIWRLKYYLGRRKNMSEEFNEMSERLIQPYINALQRALFKESATNPAIFPVSARIIELQTRKKLIYAKNNE